VHKKISNVMYLINAEMDSYISQRAVIRKVAIRLICAIFKSRLLYENTDFIFTKLKFSINLYQLCLKRAFDIKQFFKIFLKRNILRHYEKIFLNETQRKSNL
jgi:hypothetical protein